MKRLGRILLLSLFALTVVAISACGGGGNKTNGQGAPIDPSGNWTMKFSDQGGNSMFLSALFSQTGSVVTAFHVLAAGNPAPFSCVPFSATFANGQVLNVDQFSGDINSPFGNIHFSSTLNGPGTHAAGTYTLSGTCWAVASTGTFTADEVPSVSGSWTGTINCVQNCPPGSTSGTIAATLTQNDTTGGVTGTYSISGLPGIGNGNVSSGQSDVLSGFNWQATFTDNNGKLFVITGGASSGKGPGLAQDRSFNGAIIQVGGGPENYTVSMTH